MLRALGAMVGFLFLMVIINGAVALAALSPILVPATVVVVLLWALDRIFGGRRC